MTGTRWTDDGDQLDHVKSTIPELEADITWYTLAQVKERFGGAMGEQIIRATCERAAARLAAMRTAAE